MSSQQYVPSLWKRLVYSYKSIRLPWRRSILRGYDLDGNTFYESYNPLTPNKYRRTVKYLVDGHYTDNAVTPQWMAWLRHTRPNPPTLAELQGEVERIQSTRRNAVLVSRRWEEEKLRLAQVRAEALEAPPQNVVDKQDEREEMMRESNRQVEGTEKAAESDYLAPPGTRDEKGEWQPEAWKPNPRR